MKQQDISKKFHDNMNVRLANGVEIKGLRLSPAGQPYLRAESTKRPDLWHWNPDGTWHDLEESCPFNIVEVLSKPPRKYLKDMQVEDFRVGMVFTADGSSGLARVHGAKVGLFNDYGALHVYVKDDMDTLHFINEELLVSNVSRYGLYLDTEIDS